MYKQTKHTKEPLIITQTPPTSFETLCIDTVGPIKPSNNFRYILTIQCELRKYIIAFPIKSKSTTSIAKTIIKEVILKYGQFKTLKSEC